jgi:hypothetical protein
MSHNPSQLLLLFDDTREAAAIQQVLADHFPQLRCDIVSQVTTADEFCDDDGSLSHAQRPTDTVAQVVFSAAALADATLRLWQKDPAAIGDELYHLKAMTQCAMAELHSLLPALLGACDHESPAFPTRRRHPTPGRERPG